MDTTEYSNIVGVFRDRSNADQAIDALKQAGIEENQIQLTEYNPTVAAEASSPNQQESDKRIIVDVQAAGREQDAVGILAQHGANNADLPYGTSLAHGVIISTNSETVELLPGTTASANEISSDNLFGKV